MAKEKPLEEYLKDGFKDITPDENEFENIKEDENEFENIKDEDNNLKGIEEDENEFENIELEEEDKSTSKELKKISASDPSGPIKRTMYSKPIKPTPTLEKMAEYNSEQNLEAQLEEAPMPQKEEIEEFSYIGQEKEKNELYGEAKKTNGAYNPKMKITRFDEKKASAFDSDGLQEINYSANSMGGPMQRETKNDYEVSNTRMRTKRFDRDSARAFDSDMPRAYEAE